MPTTLSEILDAYLGTIRQRGSTHTALNYQMYLRKFFEVTQCQTVTDITTDTIDTFRLHLQQTRTNRAELMRTTTINYHLIALRSFIQYCHDQGITQLTEAAIPLIPMLPHARVAITTHDLAQLRDAPLTSANAEIIQYRDKALLELILTTGLKVSEIAHLKRMDVQSGKTVLAIRGLRSAVRTIHLTEQTHYWLKRYVQMRSDDATAIFVRHDKAQKTTPNALTARSIQRIIKRYAISSSLKRDITPESLRQEYAKALAASGEDIQEIKKRLGHASSTTTKRYTK